jgi:hypothetical protein
MKNASWISMEMVPLKSCQTGKDSDAAEIGSLSFSAKNSWMNGGCEEIQDNQSREAPSHQLSSIKNIND